MTIRTPSEVRADLILEIDTKNNPQTVEDLIAEYGAASRAQVLRSTRDTIKRWLTDEGDLGEGRINQICAMIWGGE